MTAATYRPTVWEMAHDIREDFPLAYHKAAQRHLRKPRPEAVEVRHELPAGVRISGERLTLLRLSVTQRGAPT